MTTIAVVDYPYPVANPDDPILTLIGAWLNAQRSPHTRAAYANDMTNPNGRVPCWLDFCTDAGIDLLTARRPFVDLWARAMETAALKPRTVSRKLSTLTSFYKYCVWEEIIPDSPIKHVKRPQVSDRGETPGLNHDELLQMLRAARAHGSDRTVALLTLLAFSGMRINEALATDITDLGHDRGHTTLTIIRKGGVSAKVALWPASVAALQQYIGDRDAGPIFISDGGHRMRQSEAWRMVRRIAKHAGLPSANELSPHSMRVTFITSAREAGAPLEDVQDAVGHVDPRTTRRYDRGRHNLDKHPAYAVGAWLADGQDGSS